jgi:DNA-binding NtrC family response regulator
MAYAWPGNVRELRQLIERVTFLTPDQEISALHLGLPAGHASASKPPSGQDDPDGEQSLPSLEAMERSLIVRALKATNGNVSQAARMLDLGREALRYRINKYDIHRTIRIDG